MPRSNQEQCKADKRVEVARAKLIQCALGFVDCTLAEMDALDGTGSASAPVEFMALHETATEYRDAVRLAENLRDGRAANATQS